MRSSDPIAIRLLSHNIRYATESPFRGEELWTRRRSKLTNELRFSTRYNPESFICLQEVLHSQLTDILNDLKSGLAHASPLAEWTYIGVGREDGDQGGEFCPILYRPRVWKLQGQKTMWLSQTPGKPSKSWDAASTRILTIGIFQHVTSQKKVVAMNTHLDDQGSKSRYEAAKIILEEVRGYCNGGSEAAEQQTSVFLAGDFNSEPTQEAYQYLNSNNSLLMDLSELVTEKEHYGHYNTFTGFGYEKEPAKRIDFLFLGPRHAVEASTITNESRTGTPALWGVEGYSVLESRFDDGIYNSDHRAILGDVLLR